MSNLEADPQETLCGSTATVIAAPTSVMLPGHDVPIGKYTVVRRLLPHRERRMVGAWCFVDHFGPEDVSSGPGMQVPPHPHTGLQTVTWLLEGEVLHRDSLGSLQTIVPGQLNLMTSGRGIAHSEESPPGHPPGMHGLQLWVALPDGARDGAARFEHHATMPVLREEGATITVVVGELDGLRSPAQVHTPLFGADVALSGGAQVSIPLRPAFEYAALTLTGTARVGDTPLDPGTLLYLGSGRDTVTLGAAGETRLFLLGGEPFDEPLVMWWNFVARSHEEIVAARDEWAAASSRFGEVRGYAGDRLPAPAMPTTRLKSRDRHGNTY
jgi:redox-sensitive bicupin YhaK (pirin superfamily)